MPCSRHDSIGRAQPCLLYTSFLTAAPSGQRTNRGRLQFDWARYYTLARPNAKSISAPEGEISDLVTLCGSTAKG